MSQEKKKICFVIAPIGLENTDIRRRSDQVLKHIIEPVANECGYDPIRADKISEPGIITSQVIQHIIEDALVIADLTGRNPNVYYELAIRHAIRKPVIQIIQAEEPIPFDVAAIRIIQVDHTDLDSVAKCKEGLMSQIRSVENDPSLVDTPISNAIDLKNLRQSENPLEKSNAEIISKLQDVKNMIGDLTNKLEHGRTSTSETYKPTYYSSEPYQSPLLSEVSNTKSFSFLNDPLYKPISFSSELKPFSFDIIGKKDEIEKIKKKPALKNRDIEPKNK